MKPDFQMIVRMVEDKPVGSIHVSRQLDMIPICGFPHGAKWSCIWQVDFIGPVTCENCLSIARLRPGDTTVLPGLAIHDSSDVGEAE